MKTMTTNLVISFATLALCGAAVAGTDKTLVSWVCLANTTQQGGSTLTIQSGDRFDGIVFGERVAGKWMAGSEVLARTQGDQQANAVEKADDKTLVQMAIVYQGNQISLYRNGEPYVSYEAGNIDLLSAKDNMAVFGQRHVGLNTGQNLLGAIEDARIYDRALAVEEIKKLQPNQPSEIKPYAWWTFEKGKEADLTGRFLFNYLDGGAKIEGGRLILTQNGELIAATKKLADMVKTPALPVNPKLMKQPEIRISPFHIRPKTGNAGDSIAFHWKGDHHLFYLHQRKWAHTVSADLIHWKDLPPALSPCGDPAGPDESCWTGSLVEHGGTFYLFYTGQNPRDPKSDQKVMLATSKDLITWEKQSDRTFYPDGKIYWSKSINGPIPGMGYHHQAFRDPDVFWYEDKKAWWMIFHALTAEGHKPCIALYTSSDLLNWTPRAPLATYTDKLSLDCPHAAPIQGRWFILAAATSYTSADKPEGPYPPDMKLYDSGDLFVPKSLFDGKRRLIWGWIRDVEGNRDNGKPQWGGTLSLPREILTGPAGQLYSRPAAEITAAFTETALDLTSKPMPDNTTGTWNYADGKLVSGPDGGACRFDVPDDYMMQATFKLDPAATLTIKMRQQKDDNAGYPLVISPKKQEVTISRAQNRFGRTIELDATQPITVQAFVQGSILECFINGKEAFTCRAYDYSTGGLSLEAAGGQMTILGLTVQTLPQKAAR
jgi:sucrose-6-phosphate hydrolase SacC (GH32 family)